MSQYYRKTVNSSGLPDDVPEQFTADDATVGVPVSNNYNILSRDTTESNVNGIQTTVDANGSANHYLELTNRFYGTASVTGAVTGDIITYDLGASAAVYRIYFEVAGKDDSTDDGVGYTVRGTIKTDGAAATLIDEPYIDSDEDTSLEDASIDFVASGNNVVLQATGVAGQTIDYKAYGYYIKV